ncbi:hypothetical protein [Fodinibius saliphilus]|uniref:hypothetical protein n=1 Tax=Fodinibius saliphilus TaxID=1920650 RepID=UPI0014872BCA|nr:hypothetical protein [Fodinibius saliphilus]
MSREEHPMNGSNQETATFDRSRALLDAANSIRKDLPPEKKKDLDLLIRNYGSGLSDTD